MVVLMHKLDIDINSENKHHYSMRTTLSLDDDVMRLVKRYAVDRSLSLGEAVSELVRRAFTLPRPTRAVNGLQVFDLPAESPRVTAKKIQELDADQR